MPAELLATIMNPGKTKKNKRRKSGKKPTPAQLAARRAFAERFGGKKRRSGKKRSTTSGTSGTSQKGQTMAQKSKRKGSPASRRSGGFVFTGGGGVIKSVAKDTMKGTILGGGALVGFVAASKGPDFLPEKLVSKITKKADGSPSTFGRLALKAGIGLLVGGGLSVAGKMTRKPMISQAAQAVIAGTVVNVGFDALAKMTDNKILPKSLSGGIAGDEDNGELGEILFDELSAGRANMGDPALN